MHQPVINKDFFVEPYQIYLARHHNADAVLLMLSVLTDQEYTELATLAKQYQLDILTEVSNEEEVHRAVALKANIIGINNRNLRDLSTDLATTEQLVPLIKQLATHEHVIISESGIYTHQDVRRLAPLVQGFLVGSSLMAEDDVLLATKQLVYGKIKVCGTTSVKGAELVKNSQASYAGLIFAEQSKRYVNLEQAKAIVDAVPNQYVGVFVNAPVLKVAEYVEALDLVAVQLHGHEEQAYIDKLKGKLAANCQIWLAKGITDSLPELSESHVDYFLLDCKVGEQTGGTGQTFDWQLLDQTPDKSKVILAGGLTADNIQQACATGVAMLDLNSGVETSPGKKDEKELTQAINALRAY